MALHSMPDPADAPRQTDTLLPDMGYAVKADNPHGLPYNHATQSATQAAIYVAHMIRAGARNVTVNGQSLPAQHYIDVLGERPDWMVD